MNKDVFKPKSQLLSYIFPPRCILCNHPGIAGRDLCKNCYTDLPWNKHACTQCAIPLAVEGDTKCGLCLRKSPAYHQSLSLFSYEGDVLKLIQNLKFNQRLSCARLLGELLCEAIRDMPKKPECIIPVPLHKKRLRERGFNQSMELARFLDKIDDLVVEDGAVERIKETTQQIGLKAPERRKNIKDAFKIVKALPYKHVAILDDVVTTGATVNELAKVLLKAGVERVDVFSIARAPLK